MIHEVAQHVGNNWHKYAVLYFIVKEVKGGYAFIPKIKTVWDNLAWAWGKITGLFHKHKA